MRTECDAYEELLVLRAQGGDHRALAALVDYWHPPLTRHALRLTGEADGAAEVMQESWLAIVRSLGRLTDPACARSWAYRIVTHKCTDWVRRRARSRQVTQPLQEDMLTELSPSHDSQDESGRLRDALRLLAREQRVILSMFYVDDMSVREIAEACSLPAGTVKSRLFHARNRLKQILERTDP
ncbi:MAG: RNA polymerase sigma factor [Pirellulaceae bacterium]|jgi:RNA polymerase sigma-70 factor (ECF subfamily)|nr:RNA polymerase sigma factor [Pirellulaceae bacterium]